MCMCIYRRRHYKVSTYMYNVCAHTMYIHVHMYDSIDCVYICSVVVIVDRPWSACWAGRGGDDRTSTREEALGGGSTPT